MVATTIRIPESIAWVCWWWREGLLSFVKILETMSGGTSTYVFFFFKKMRLQYHNIIHTKCGEYTKIFHGILSIPRNIIVDLNNVMIARLHWQINPSLESWCDGIWNSVKNFEEIVNFLAKWDVYNAKQVRYPDTKKLLPKLPIEKNWNLGSLTCRSKFDNNMRKMEILHKEGLNVLVASLKVANYELSKVQGRLDYLKENSISPP